MFTIRVEDIIKNATIYVYFLLTICLFSYLQWGTFAECIYGMFYVTHWTPVVHTKIVEIKSLLFVESFVICLCADKCRSKRNHPAIKEGNIVSRRFNLLQYLSRLAITGTIPLDFIPLVCVVAPLPCNIFVSSSWLVDGIYQKECCYHEQLNNGNKEQPDAFLKGIERMMLNCEFKQFEVNWNGHVVISFFFCFAIDPLV